MKPIKSTLFMLFLALSAGATDVPNPGPRSEQEAKFLFDQAQEEIGQSNHKGAIHNLERLVERYPRDERHLRAQELLITLYLASQDAKAAAKVAKNFLHADSRSETSHRVRTQLIEAYFLLGKNTEARATAKDLLKNSKTDSTRSRALFILAKIDTKEKKWNEARAKLDALPTPISAIERDGLLLQIGVSECNAAKTPAKTVKMDDPWIEYFEQQILCFKTLAAGQAQKSSARGYPDWCASFKSLRQTLDQSRINAFQKTRLMDELRKTASLAEPMDCGV